jgi:hypothetical protein
MTTPSQIAVEPQACCNHSRVVSKRNHHEGGTVSEYWECADNCGCKFVPTHYLQSAIDKVAAPCSDAVEMLRKFEQRIDINFPGYVNAGTRGWLKIEIHNIIIKLGREPYAIHDQPNDPSSATRPAKGSL